MQVMTTTNPGQRGGAGVVDRTSTTDAGPACALQRVTRITFAIRLAKTPATKAKRAAAVAEHIDAVTGAVVSDEWADGDRLWITVHVWPPLRLAEALHVAEGCPEYVKDSERSGRPLQYVRRTAPLLATAATR